MNPVYLEIKTYSSEYLYKNKQFNCGFSAFTLIFVHGRPNIYDQAFADSALDLKFFTLINTQ